MALQSEEMTNIRRYLLGDMTLEEREPVELRLLTDDDYFDEFRLAKEDLIERYNEGEMSAQERAQFEKHFLTTKDRYDSLRIAQALLDQNRLQKKAKARKKDSGWQPFAWAAAFFSTPLGAAASVVVAIAIVGSGVYLSRPSDVTKGIAALDNAYKVERPIEARVSDFQYVPLANKRSGEPVQFDANSRLLAEALLTSAVESKPSASSYHALAKLDLFEEHFDDAIRNLVQALKTEPDNAKIHSDLGAAWLEKGAAEIRQGDGAKGSESLANSLKHLNRALEIEPSLLEPLFNRALVRTHQKLFRLAEEDWKLYLQKDATSPWAGEARENLKTIEQLTRVRSDTENDRYQAFLVAQRAGDDDTAWRLLSRNRDFSGGAIENKLIDEYLAAVLSDKPDAARQKFAALLYAGELTVRRANDHFFSDLAKFYSKTTQLQKIAEARQLLLSGHALLRNDKTDEAIALYNDAARIFAENGDTGEALFVKYPLAQARLLQSESQQSLELLEAIRDLSAANRYRWLEGQTLSALANVHIGLNNFSIALELSQRSLAVLTEVDDQVGIAKVNDQLGVEYMRVGNPREALAFHRRAASLVSEQSLGALPAWRTYYTAAVPFHALGLDDAAIDFTTEALKIAPDTKSPVNVSHSYAQLGVMYGELGSYDRAIEHLQQAVSYGKAATTEKVRIRALGYAALQLGNLYRRRGEYKRAIESYEEALRLYNQIELDAFSYVAHKGKFLACAAEGPSCPSMETELSTALLLYEQHRGKILEMGNRYSFFDNEQGVYDVAIDYEFATKGDKQKAFDYSERCRARSLLDLAEGGQRSVSHHAQTDSAAPAAVESAKLQEIQGQLPENAQIVQYSVLADKLLIWFISKNKFEGFQQSISSQALNEKVSTYLRLIASRSESDEGQRLATELYELLVQPISALLEDGKLVCVVPDKALNSLPYAALMSPADRTYLIEHYDLTFSPSATMFIRRSQTAAERQVRTEKALIVGDPQFDTRVYPSFKYLPAAYVEAKQIEKLYTAPQVLTRSEATESRVVAGMERADVIHLATHAVVDEQSPMYSKLLLAKSTGRDAEHNHDGVLFTNEIYNLSLRARLVVLPACRTGFERYYGGEGMIGIWSPFVTRNVPLVIASLWAVDSDSTKDLMVNFHKLRTQSHLSSAAALRQAQLAMLHGPDKTYRQPYHWASFIAIGGHTTF